MSSLVSPTLLGVGGSNDDVIPTPKGLRRLGIPLLRTRKLEGLLLAAGILAAGFVVSVPMEYINPGPFAERVLAAEHVQNLAVLRAPPEPESAHRTYLMMPRYQLPLMTGTSHQQVVSKTGV